MEARAPKEKVVGRVSADRHERAGAERSLAGVAHEQVEADAGERHDQKWDEHRIEPVLAGEQRQEPSATAPIKTARAGVLASRRTGAAIADTGKVRSVTDDMR